MRRPEIINTIQEILQRVASDATTILYGSEARGEVRPDSGIDLLILVDKEMISLCGRQAIVPISFILIMIPLKNYTIKRTCFH